MNTGNAVGNSNLINITQNCGPSIKYLMRWAYAMMNVRKCSSVRAYAHTDHVHRNRLRRQRDSGTKHLVAIREEVNLCTDCSLSYFVVIDVFVRKNNRSSPYVGYGGLSYRNINKFFLQLFEEASRNANCRNS